MKQGGGMRVADQRGRFQIPIYILIMEYYKNYMADAVVRVDDDGKRFVKWIDYMRGREEFQVNNPESKTAFGGEGYGVFYILEPISKEDYDTFGRTWTFGYYGEKTPLY